VDVLNGLTEDGGGLSGRDSWIGDHPLLAEQRVNWLLFEFVVFGCHAPKLGIRVPNR
jgi:hypothetical protein